MSGAEAHMTGSSPAGAGAAVGGSSTGPGAGRPRRAPLPSLHAQPPPLSSALQQQQQQQQQQQDPQHPTSGNRTSRSGSLSEPAAARAYAALAGATAGVATASTQLTSSPTPTTASPKAAQGSGSAHAASQHARANAHARPAGTGHGSRTSPTSGRRGGSRRGSTSGSGGGGGTGGQVGGGHAPTRYTSAQQRKSQQQQSQQQTQQQTQQQRSRSRTPGAAGSSHAPGPGHALYAPPPSAPVAKAGDPTPGLRSPSTQQQQQQQQQPLSSSSSPPQQQQQQQQQGPVAATGGSAGEAAVGNGEEHAQPQAAPPSGDVGEGAVAGEGPVALTRAALTRPAYALSMGIMQVYQGINNKFYSEQRSRGNLGGQQTFNNGYDDAEGHYIHIIGERIADRYTVQGLLGKGSFGTVLLCCDEKYQEEVAMKVIRSGAYFEAQGRLEMDIVLYLNQKEELQNLVMMLRKAFYWQGHIVLVFELLSYNLYELIKCTHYNGVSLDLTRKFAFQLLQVLYQLDNHRPRIIHCDIKPENVVLKDRKRSGIRVIDFGSSCYQLLPEWVMPPPLVPLGTAPASDRRVHFEKPKESGSTGAEERGKERGRSPQRASASASATATATATATTAPVAPQQSQDEQQQPQRLRKPVQHPSFHKMPRYIQSRFYRSPEVILELGYTTAIDRWSLGCMVVELHTGVPLFPGLNEAEMLGLFTAVLGPLPDEMIAASPKFHLFYVDTRVEGAHTAARGGMTNATDTTPAAAPLTSTGEQPTRARAATALALAAASVDGHSRSRGHAHRSVPPPTAPSALAHAPGPAQASPQGTASAVGEWDSNSIHRRGGLRAATAGSRPQDRGEAGVAHAESGAGAAPARRALPPSVASASSDRATGSASSDLGDHAGQGAVGRPRSRAARPLPAPPGGARARARPSPFELRHPPKPEWCRGLAEIIGVHGGGPRGCRKGQAGHDPAAYEAFLSFAQGLLAYDPRRRTGCADALEHAFLAPLKELERQAAAALAGAGAGSTPGAQS